MRVLITAPSLDENKNVSGISTVVRQIVEHGAGNYTHFVAGRADGEASGIAWALRQLALPFKFRQAVAKAAPDVVHINTALTSAAIVRDAVLARMCGSWPTVVSIHGGRFLVEPIASPIVRKLAAGMLSRARSVVVLSEAERQLVLARWPLLADKLRVLPNAVMVSQDTHSRAEGAHPRLIFVGRLHESKGLRPLVEGLRELRARGHQFSLAAYGDGPLKEWFIAAMSELLGADFRSGGVVTSVQARQAMRSADIFVLPSLYGEGLPMAMLEAMSEACVCVVSDIASVATVIEPGVNGFVVEPGNVGELVATLEQLFTRRSDWAQIGAEARRTVAEKYSLEIYLKNLAKIYEEAVR